MQSFYMGMTDGTYYQDDTGNAYLAVCAEDNNNSIVTLYKGCFIDGEFYDNSAAWEITRKGTNKYIYRKGPFENNRSINQEYTIIDSLDDINKFIENASLECPLRWDSSILDQ